MVASESPVVLAVTSTFPRWSGDEQPRFVLDLCRFLSQYCRVIILAPHTKGALREEVIEGMRVVRFKYGPEQWESVCYEGGMLARVRQRPLRVLMLPAFVVCQIAAIRRLVRRYQVEILHAHWIVPQGVCSAVASSLSGRRVRVVCTSHGGDLFALNGWLMRMVKRLTIRHVDTLTVVSNAMRQRVQGLVPEMDRVEVIPMGTDLREQFVPPEGTAQRRCDELLFVGRLVEKKGVDLLIRVLGRLKRENGLRPRLTIVGSGPEEGALRAIVEEEGVSEQVSFEGFRAHGELPKLYRQCSVALFPFREDSTGDQEGFGLVVVEALGCGCAVVVSDMPAVRDVVGEAVALTLPSDDLSAWTGAIRELVSDPGRRDELARAGRKYVVERFDWEVCGKRYAECLMRGGGIG